MIEYWLPIANVAATAVLLVCCAVVLMVINTESTGKARILGILGVIVVLVSTTLAALNGSVAPWFMRIYGSDVDVYGLGSIAAAGVGAVGLVILALAVVAARKAARPLGGR